MFADIFLVIKKYEIAREALRINWVDWLPYDLNLNFYNTESNLFWMKVIAKGGEPNI